MKKIADTEKRNENTKNIDLMSSKEIVEAINREDRKVLDAVKEESENIARAIDEVVKSFRNGGRLFYFGAGTSGRLGVLDASECPPTFGVDVDMVHGIIAGGDEALRFSIEGAEDSYELGVEDLQRVAVSEKDVVVGVSASGNNQYILGAMIEAKKIGAKAIAVCCNEESLVKLVADVYIGAVVGAEVVTGSTRMKAGTAQKMILNMLTTGAMIRIGKTYENLMVDVTASNEKLKRRCVSIVCDITGVDDRKAEEVLIKCDWKVKIAVVMIARGVEISEAEQLLEGNDGVLRRII